MFTQSIPFAGHHGSIVIGKGGKTINQISLEMRCSIETKKPEPQHGRPLPYFYISGYTELMVLRTTMRIQQLILKSNSRTEKELIDKTTMLKSEISKIHLEQENKTVKKVRFNLEIKNITETCVEVESVDSGDDDTDYDSEGEDTIVVNTSN